MWLELIRRVEEGEEARPWLVGWRNGGKQLQLVEDVLRSPLVDGGSQCFN